MSPRSDAASPVDPSAYTGSRAIPQGAVPGPGDRNEGFIGST